MIDTAIIIVNWNGIKYVCTCIDMILSQDKKQLNRVNIIVVDNASSDGSVLLIKKKFFREIKIGQITVIVNNTNLGFAKGNNIGISYALNNYSINDDTIRIRNIILINNDIFVEKNWLSELLRFADKNTDIGMISCKTLLMDETVDTMGLKHSITGMFYDIKSENELKKLVCPSGAAALYTRELLEDVQKHETFCISKNKYFDEDFFLYDEDVDLGFRANNLGWKPGFASKAITHHIHSASTKNNKSVSIYYGNRNSLWTIFKNYSTTKLVFYMPIILAYQLIVIVWYIITGHGKIILKSKIDALKKFKMMRKKHVIR